MWVRKVSVHMYPHTTIVYFYIRIPKNLVNVGSSRHKLPRHRKNSVGDTDPSGQNWSDTVCRRGHVATCRRHFQLRQKEIKEPSGRTFLPHKQCQAPNQQWIHSHNCNDNQSRDVIGGQSRNGGIIPKRTQSRIPSTDTHRNGSPAATHPNPNR
jgi:hypothetical protein